MFTGAGVSMRRRIILTGSAIAVALSCLAFVLIHERLGTNAVTSEHENLAPSLTKKRAIAKTGGHKLGILDLYKQLELGMSWREVEDIVGKPMYAPLEYPNGEVRAEYLGREYAERSLLPHESPISPAGNLRDLPAGKIG